MKKEQKKSKAAARKRRVARVRSTKAVELQIPAIRIDEFGGKSDESELAPDPSSSTFIELMLAVAIFATLLALCINYIRGGVEKTADHSEAVAVYERQVFNAGVDFRRATSLQHPSLAH